MSPESGGFFKNLMFSPKPNSPDRGKPTLRSLEATFLRVFNGCHFRPLFGFAQFYGASYFRAEDERGRRDDDGEGAGTRRLYYIITRMG